MAQKKSFLFHICCAPCAAAIAPELIQKFNITFFWHNPNIAPDDEHTKRKENAKKYAAELGVNFIETLKSPAGLWRENALNASARCNYCYDTRIKTVIEFAGSSGFDFFSTSLLSSPYQKHDYIKDLCASSPAFYYIDGRKNFYEGKNGLRAKGYYLQKYCGCLMSKLEREKK